MSDAERDVPGEDPDFGSPGPEATRVSGRDPVDQAVGGVGVALAWLLAVGAMVVLVYLLWV